jgi:N-acetyl-gamma-glutamyl-phosphate reductase
LIYCLGVVVMIRVGVYGASGYTGYELLRILAGHREAEVAFATSESSAGKRLGELYPCFSDLLLVAQAEAQASEIDAAFCCLPHGASMELVRDLYLSGVRVVDLSADFRLRDPAAYRRWYGLEHVAPELLPVAVYGLPEVRRQAIEGAALVANPGCYPTAAMLALHPLLKVGAVAERRAIIDAKSGVSGAGRKLSLSTHFVEANENFSPYSIGSAHRHLSEMLQEAELAAGGPCQLIFAPHLLPVNRGILATVYVRLGAGWDITAVRRLYEEAYAGEPFVRLLPPGQLATLAHSVNTNRCVISLTEAGDGSDLIVVSSIDNLVKGASGQAVQNMNLMFGLEESMGLEV